MTFLNNFFSPRRPNARRAHLTVKADRYDRRAYEEILAAMPDLDKTRRRLARSHETAHALTEDTFHLLHKVEPEPVPAEDLDPDYFLNALIRDQLLKNPLLADLRDLGTIGDDVNSGLGVVAISEDLAAIADRMKTEQELVKQAQALLAQLAQALEGMGSANQRLDALREQLSELDEQDAGQERSALTNQIAQIEAFLAEAQQQISDLHEAIEAAKQQVREGLEAKEYANSQSLTHGLTKAVRDAEDLASLSSWGSENGPMTKLDPAARLALAQRVKKSPKLQQLARLIGRFTRVAQAEQRKRVDRSPTMVVSVERGSDLSQVLPSELVKLRHPLLKGEFRRDFLDRNLLQYKKSGTERVGLGPIICLFDGSGSMSGDREVYAKAVAFSLLNIAREQRRAFHAIQFGSPTELRSWDFRRPEDYSQDKVLAMAEFFFGGGTDFQAPLSLALARLQDDDLVNGDIVFITDGICAVGPHWLEQFKAEQDRLGFHVFGVLIGPDPESEPLKTICDGRVVSVKSLTSADDLRDVYRNLHTPTAT